MLTRLSKYFSMLIGPTLWSDLLKLCRSHLRFFSFIWAIQAWLILAKAFPSGWNKVPNTLPAFTLEMYRNFVEDLTVVSLFHL